MAARKVSKRRKTGALPEAVSSSAPLPAWRRHAWRVCLVWALSLIAYANSFQAGFVFDNRSIILEDVRVQSASAENISRILTTEYWPDRQGSGLYRPITTLSYLFN